MILKTTSSKAVLAKVWRTFKPDEPGWKQDAISWLGEGLELIGHFAGTHKKSSPAEGNSEALNVANHRVRIPCDLESIIAVEYNGYRLPYGGDVTLPGLVCDDRTTNVQPYESNLDQDLLLGNSTVQVQTLPGSNQKTNDYYQVNPDYIIASFEAGYIKLHYNAFYTDKDGFPLVPDRTEFIQALSWYIMYQMMLGGYKHPAIRDWKEAEKQFDHWAEQASNYAKYPSIDKMDLFKRMWVRMLPQDHFPDDFFMGAETPEQLPI